MNNEVIVYGYFPGHNMVWTNYYKPNWTLAKKKLTLRVRVFVWSFLITLQYQWKIKFQAITHYSAFHNTLFY
jgi:hypothetical protein